MNKKLVALCLCIAILASALTAGTLAYFTDKSEVATNTFTTGNVKILQHELQRNKETGVIEPFEQGQVMVPTTKTDILGGDENMHHEDVNGVETAFETEKNGEKNIIDKIVQVQNVGSVDAYVGTIIAYEDTNDVSGPYKQVTGGWSWKAMRDTSSKIIQIKEVDDGDDTTVEAVYTLGCFVHSGILGKDEYAVPALTQLIMESTATQKDVAAAGATYDVLAVSFGVQADGFDNADQAVEAAFGFKALRPSTNGDMQFQATAEGIKTLESWFDAAKYELGWYNNGTFEAYK